MLRYKSLPYLIHASGIASLWINLKCRDHIAYTLLMTSSEFRGKEFSHVLSRWSLNDPRPSAAHMADMFALKAGLLLSFYDYFLFLFFIQKQKGML